MPGKYAYHRVFKYNYRNISNENIISDVHILPENFTVNFSNFHLDENSFSYEFIAIEEFCDNFVAPYYFIAFIYMYSPIDENSKRKEVLIILEEEAKDFVPVKDKLNHFDFNIQKSSFKIMNEFQKIMAFPGIVSHNKKQKLVWAESISVHVKGELDVVVPLPIVELPKSDEPYRSFIIDVK